MSTISKKKDHLVRSVITGYITFIVLAIGSGIYIYHLITQIANEKKVDNTAREKIYIITNTLSLLYESETYTQFINTPDEEFEQFNQTLDLVHEQMELLRFHTPDTSAREKIDRIEELLEQKRTNTQQLLHTVKEIDKIYSRNLARRQTSVRKESEEEVEVQKQEKIQKDTIVVQKQKRGFFKRLAEAFVPDKEDSTVIVNTTNRIQKDSFVNTYVHEGDTINKVLDQIKKNIASEQAQLNEQLSRQTSKLRHSNNIITNEINQLLLEIEEEEMMASDRDEQKKQELIHKASEKLAIIAILSVMVVLIFIFITLRDISRSRYYRKQLEKSKLYTENLLQSRERLMLTISHDIRSPLSSILGYIELLRKNPGKNPEEYIDHMGASAKHILALVNDLLDFHKLDSGQMEIHPEPFNINALFNEIYASFKPIAEAKKLSFEMQIEEETHLPAYSGDTVRIRQIVGNFLSNAIKFTSKGNVLMHVSVFTGDDNKNRLKISVKDEGPGINKAEQEKIFEEFTRLAGSEKAEGFGLGLSIAGKLISLMHGEVSLESEPGKGSEFIVTIPLSAAETELQHPSVSESTGISSSQKKINSLVIDDDKLQLKLMEELLKGHQVNVIGLSDADKVIDLLKNGRFDVLFTDIQMPGIDGYTLLKQIRTSGIPGAETFPVIALSASNAEQESHYMEAGFTGFLVKPFTSNDLGRLLNKLFPSRPDTVKSLNISSLTAFAGDDKGAAGSILKTFTEETGKSIDLLKEALENEDQKLASNVSHKLIPLFSMLEANALVGQLRILEEGKLPVDQWKNILREVIKQSTSVVEEVLLANRPTQNL